MYKRSCVASGFVTRHHPTERMAKQNTSVDFSLAPTPADTTRRLNNAYGRSTIDPVIGTSNDLDVDIPSIVVNYNQAPPPRPLGSQDEQQEEPEVSCEDIH